MTLSLGDLNVDILNCIVRVLCADPATDLDALKNFSMAFKSARTAVAPFIFRCVVTREDWSVDSLRALCDMNTIHTCVQTFTFAPSPAYEADPVDDSVSERRPFVDPEASRSMTRRPTYDLVRISQCIELLADLLRSYTSLQTLIFDIGDWYESAVADKVLAMLRKAGLYMPSVRALAIADTAVPLFVGKICPRVTDLSVRICGRHSVGEWSPAPGITRLELRRFTWSYPDSHGVIPNAILKTMPNVINLTVDAPVYSGSIENHLRIFRGFSNLEVLSIAGLEDLSLGYNFGHRLRGNAWIEMRHLVSLDDTRDNAVGCIKRVARDNYPSLQYLWVGNLMLIDFSQMKASDANALDRLQPAWSAYHSDDEVKLRGFLEAHPECEKFLIRHTSFF